MASDPRAVAKHPMVVERSGDHREDAALEAAAFLLVGFWWAAQHSFLRLVFDWRFMLWRFLAFLPGVLALMVLYPEAPCSRDCRTLGSGRHRCRHDSVVLKWPRET
jgi:hypothetical protein